uniref:Cytoplasmic polyadenylation element-binding protein 1 n=1 Tax=Ditylenchus dipsaci TaxID=166011 RepID=A0A915DPT0_9BILA
MDALWNSAQFMNLASGASHEYREQYSRKVFIGGLPIDITDSEINNTFAKFGRLFVDWPRRSEIINKERRGKNVTGYVFLIYESEPSVQELIKKCYCDAGRYYLLISSPTMREKPVQVRPWCLTDMDYMPRPNFYLEPRRTVFIGGVPRPTKASEIAFVLESHFGSVCYVGIDIDPELKYPKGAARVTFNTTKSFVAAISGKFVNIPHGDGSKRVEIKPYVMDDQPCDQCLGKMCSDRYAPYFCGDVSCLQYYCEVCWDLMHCNSFAMKKRSSHKPFVRLGDQTKLLQRLPHHQNNV